MTIVAGRMSDIRRSFAVALASGDMYLPAYFAMVFYEQAEPPLGICRRFNCPMQMYSDSTSSSEL